MQKEKRLIKRPGARSPGPDHGLPYSHEPSTPSTSHMFWNLSPLRGGVGGGGGQTSVWPRREAIFSAAGPIRAASRGAAVPGSGMCWGELSRRYRAVELGPHTGATDPLLSGGGGS